jgi:hypothetical protein
MKLIDDWRPRGCKTEKDLERSLHRRLEKNLENADIIMQYAVGRVKGDIVVDHEILIELKDKLKSTGELQRLLGQLDIYDARWKGNVIVVVCGDSQRDLVKTLRKKVAALKPQKFLLTIKAHSLVRRRAVAPRKDDSQRIVELARKVGEEARKLRTEHDIKTVASIPAAAVAAMLGEDYELVMPVLEYLEREGKADQDVWGRWIIK